MESLLAIVRELSTARTLADVQGIVRSAARALTGADGATFVLREGDRCFYADEDAIAPLWKGRRFPMSACISGWAMLHGQCAVIEDVYTDDRVPQDVYRPTFVRSLAMMPVRARQPLAAIGVYWAAPHRATTAELGLLQALADSTAIALENVTLLHDLDAARKAAARTSRLEDQFLAVVSNELRTPLAPILALAATLQDGTVRDGEQVRSMAAAIHAYATTQLAHVDALLDMTRLLAGKVRPQARAAEVGALVGAAVDAIEARAAARQVAVQRRVAATLPRLDVDPELLGRALALLLENALQATSPGGTIGVLVAVAGATLRIAVTDHGAGIAAADLPHVFDPFRRRADDGARGSSLGLATVRHLVALHGGIVTADSDGEGRGATFTLALPIAGANTSAARVPAG